MTDKKPKFNFRMIIHTCQMCSCELPISIDEINSKRYIIKPRVRLTSKGYLYPLNANKVTDVEINNLSEFLKVIRQIQTDLRISEWSFDRIDFAFDTALKYDDIYKYSLYILAMVSAVTGIKNAIETQDANSKKKEH